MPNLPYITCPQCGGALPIKVLWEFSRHSRFDLVGRYGTLTGRIGIACPSCGVKLRIVQTRIRIFLVASSAAFFAVVAYLLRSMHSQHTAVNKLPLLLGLTLASFALYRIQRALIPHLTQVRPALPEEHLGYPLSSAYEGPSESLLDAADSASNNRWRSP
jgi:DNA-directed RNA polymerase subunit RPC12/RpoP